MEGTNLESPSSSIHDTPQRWNLVNKLIDNPIISKELKGRMRGKQGFILLTAYLLLISLVITSVYSFSEDNQGASRVSQYALADLGKQVFNTVVMLEFLMIVFIGPALTSGAISSERERGTFDLLRVSLVSSRALVLGKLGSTVIYLLLLIFTALPLQSLAFFLGGVGLPEMFISLGMLAVSAFFFCTLGLYYSSLAKRTIIATVLSYTTLILPAVLLGFLYLMLENGNLDLSNPPIEAQRVIIIFAWTLLSTNPFTAAFLAETLLVEEQSLFIFYPPDFALSLFSPWILYIIFAGTMTVLMIWLIVFYLDRYER